jgi:2-polyprenyl-3-methyl-5-hydroxy-6-metoxy-1,4-benzoquinol methylase
MSVEYYTINAQAFISDTISVDMTDIYQRFTRYLRSGDLILDAGCGSGRDSKAFIAMGYHVEAFDACPEMVTFASSYTGINVDEKSFEQVNEVDKFDAIWCCASLLHVARAELSGVLIKLITTLKKGGILYVSFKHGTDEYQKNGRYFSDQTESSLAALLQRDNNVQLLDIWCTSDMRPNRNEKWLNGIYRKL